MSANDQAPVRIAWSSIQRHREQIDGGDIWVLLRGKGGSLADFDAAVEEADGATEAEHLDEEDDEPIYSLSTAATPRGYVVQVATNDWQIIERWLTHLAERLASHGLIGTLTAAPSAPVPDWANNLYVRYPAAYVSWMLDMTTAAADSEGLQRWYVPADATQRIARLADRWARLADAQMMLAQGRYRIAADLDDASELLAKAPPEAGSGEIQFFHTDPQHATHVSLDPTGMSTFQDFGAGTWQHQVAHARQALLALPADLAHGYVRYAPRMIATFQQLFVPYPLPADISEYVVWRNPHLHDRYLPDAHGIQVITTTHRDAAHDLSRWTITDLGHDRHLVEAPDLEPWYSTPVPDPDVLAQARADFHGALLTRQAIKTNPSPWE